VIKPRARGNLYLGALTGNSHMQQTTAGSGGLKESARRGTLETSAMKQLYPNTAKSRPGKYEYDRLRCIMLRKPGVFISALSALKCFSKELQGIYARYTSPDPKPPNHQKWEEAAIHIPFFMLPFRARMGRFLMKCRLVAWAEHVSIG